MIKQETLKELNKQKKEDYPNNYINRNIKVTESYLVHKLKQ